MRGWSLILHNLVQGPVFFSAALYYCLALLLQLRKGYDSVLPISGRTLVRGEHLLPVLPCAQLHGAKTSSPVMFFLFSLCDRRRGHDHHTDRRGRTYRSKLLKDRGWSPSAAQTQPSQRYSACWACRTGAHLKLFEKGRPCCPTALNVLHSFLQVFSFTVYLALLFTVLVKRARQPDFAARQWRETTLLTTLAVTSILIYLRTFFRLAEAAEGVMSSSMRNQGLFASLETVPVIVVALVWALLPLTFLLK